MSVRHRAMILAFVAATAPMTLSSCARQISPGVVSGPAVGEVQSTWLGTVEQVRPVQVQENDLLQQNHVGQLIGGALGGAAGSRFGQGWGKAAAVGAGALLGAGVGSVAQQELQRQQGLEYVVRTDDGRLLTVVQGPAPHMHPGDRVYVQQSARGRSRVVPAA